MPTSHPQQDKNEQRAAELPAVEKQLADAEAAIDAKLAALGDTKVHDFSLDEEPQSIAALASQGRDALVEAMRKHTENAPAPYQPPPMTERQLSQTEREMEAGRRANERHAAQQATRPQPAPTAADGTSTPVYRPGHVVPDPALTAGKSAAGTRVFGKDA